tara:strand:+ start:863 stop:1627 length:765 start_codon:yes stop_codon:yes gene_type:complete
MDKDNNYEFGVFYDNSSWNLEGSENLQGLLSILVFETDEEKSSFVGNREKYLNIIKSQEKYPYIMDILDNCDYLKDDMVDHLSGINEKQIDHLIDLIKKPEIKIKFVILDFDRTITKIEGILDAKDLLDKIPPEVVAKYYFGGVERLEKLHELFEVMHNHHVDLFILTNNEALDYIYKILKVADLIRDPLKYIYYNSELVNDFPNKIQTIYTKLSTIHKYRNVFNNNCSDKLKENLVNYLETEDNSKVGDSKFI